MAFLYGFRQLSYKRILVLLAASGLGVGFSASTAQGQAPMAANVAIGADDESASRANRNIIRADLGTIFGYNFSYNFWKDHGFVLPVLLSYERHVGGKWSVGGEALINGGDPTQRRSGVGLSARYYALPSGQHIPPLTGAYLAPVMHYRALRITEGYWGSTPSITRGQRFATGLLLGWQQPIGRRTGPRLVVDLAAGAYYQMRMGTDQVDDPYSYYSAFRDTENRASVRPGFRPDVRMGIGYQF